MNSFKLLHLPWLAFQEIMKTMDFIALFNLSRISNWMFLRIKLTRRKILPIEIVLTEEAHLVKITDEKRIEGEKAVFKLNFFLRKDVSGEDREEKMIRKATFGGREIEIGKQREYHDSYPGFLGLNILSVRIGNDDDCSSWSEQEISLLLDYTKPTYQLRLECDLTSDFNDKSILNFPRVSMIDMTPAQWLKIEDLMTMNSSTIVLDDHNFTENDLKQYIQHWLAGTDQTLTRFQCGRFRTRPNWDDILEDVEYSKWDEKRRSRYHIYNSINSKAILDCKEGLDFERSDGKLASVFQNSEWFCFVVWHHRFH